MSTCLVDQLKGLFYVIHISKATCDSHTSYPLLLGVSAEQDGAPSHKLRRCRLLSPIPFNMHADPCRYTEPHLILILCTTDDL